MPKQPAPVLHERTPSRYLLSDTDTQTPEEVKYELSDFLYHAMVLMVEKGITWEDITQELAER